MNPLSRKLDRLERANGVHAPSEMLCELGPFTAAEIANIMRQVSGRTRGLPSERGV